MGRYVLRRVTLLPVTFLILAFVIFCILRLTADPILLYLDIDATPEAAAVLRAELHLDKPLAVQFLYFLAELARGDFGVSHVFHQPALPLIGQRLGPTLMLVGAAMAIAVGGGILLGMLCAVRRDRPTDFVISALAVVGQSMPSFWLGILLIQLFALHLGWLPTSGMGGPEHLVLPALTLAAIQLPNFVLVTRTAMLETMGEQFVVTARAKGLRTRRVLFRHVLPNAVTPVLTLLGLQLGLLIGGSIVTESIFAWPGVGRLIISSIFQRDVSVVIAGVFVISLAIMLCNLAVDLLLSALDPRIRRD
ncbi:MAG: ABC transporter permease [Alphaproteobacteria bacterium]|nr:ABC transporter permease [Alphaproteobacteria bacterium]